MNSYKKEIVVELNPDGPSKVFATYADLEKWFSDEEKKWNWLRTQDTRYKEKLSNHFHQLRVIFRQIETIPEQGFSDATFEPLLKFLKNTYGKGDVFASDSSEGAYVLSLKEIDIVVASGAINYFKNLGIPTDDSRRLTTDIGKQIQGFILANNFRENLSESRVKNRLSSILSKVSNESKTLFEALTTELSANREIYSQNSKNLEELVNQLSSAITTSETKVQETIDHLQTRAIEIENIYKEKVQLQAPTQYFSAQSLMHSKEAKKYFRIFTGITVGFLILFCLLVTVVFGNTVNINDIEKYLILAGFFTFGTWFIRTYYRIYINHQHLKTISGEKEVLVKVYLSLLDSDKGLAKEDRALILTPLFRVPQNIFSKGDSGPGSPVEILLRNIQN